MVVASWRSLSGTTVTRACADLTIIPRETVERGDGTDIARVVDCVVDCVAESAVGGFTRSASPADLSIGGERCKDAASATSGRDQRGRMKQNRGCCGKGFRARLPIAPPMHSKNVNLTTVRAACLIALSLLIGATDAFAQMKVASIPSASVRVNDNASMLTEDQAAKLDRLFEEYQNQHQTRLVLLTVASTAPEEIDRYTQRVAEAWKIGQPSGAGDVMIVVARSNPSDLGRIRITARPDLRAALNDDSVERIIAEDIAPRFQTLDYYGGLLAGVDRVKLLLEGGTLPPPPVEPVRGAEVARPLVDPNVVIAALVFVFIVVLLMFRHATRRRMSYLAGDRAVNRAFTPMIVGGFVGRSRHVSLRGDNGFGGGYVGPGVGGYGGAGGDFAGGSASAKW